MSPSNIVQISPTGLEYIPGLHKAYTSNRDEEKIGVMDLRTLLVIKGLPELNPAENEVIGRYLVQGCWFDHGMAVESR